MKKLILILTAVCVLFACAAATAEGTAATTQATVYETADGVLSIRLPGPDWVVLSDPNYWFAMTDGDDVITISHLSNGEALPAIAIADSEYSAVCNAYVSTENEVFVIKGCAVSTDSLEDIMLALSTVKILKYNTKLAVNTAGAGADTDRLTVVPANQVLYSISNHLNVRTDCTTDSRKLGYLTYGQPVIVNGIVRLNGRDYGWYRISYNGRMGYVSAKFLSTVVPQQQTQVFSVYAENGATAAIHDVGNGYYEDTNGHSYRYVHGSLYYRKDNDTTYSQDPTYWNRYQNGTEAFWVYAKNGGAVQIYEDPDGNYRDAAGNTYFQNNGNIYYCHDTDVEYSPDPNHWANAQEEVYTAFTVYGENDTRATIHWSQSDAAYVDESGITYDLISGNLYSRNTDQMLFSPDADHWVGANVDEDAPYAVSDAFRIYAKDGSSVEIFERSDGKYADYMGCLYENTAGGLWYCDETNMEYSTDPNEWSEPEPEMDGRDYGENDDMDGSDYGENDDMDGSDYGENDDE